MAFSENIGIGSCSSCRWKYRPCGIVLWLSSPLLLLLDRCINEVGPTAVANALTWDAPDVADVSGRLPGSGVDNAATACWRLTRSAALGSTFFVMQRWGRNYQNHSRQTSKRPPSPFLVAAVRFFCLEMQRWRQNTTRIVRGEHRKGFHLFLLLLLR